MEFDRAEIIAEVCGLVTKDRHAAIRKLKSEYPFVGKPTERKSKSVKAMMPIFKRDGFVDRYTGKRVVNTGALRMLGLLLPEDFPWHSHSNSAKGHPALLQFREVEKPTPKDNEVLIRIGAVTVNTGDCEMRRPEIPNMIWFLIRLFFGLRKPRKQILGAYFAGEIEAVGKDVEQFQVKDQVFAASGARFGAYAEYICLPSNYTIAAKPANMTYEEAAAVPLGGLNALHYLRKAKVQNGESVLINGAGGSFGTFAVQLAKLMGAKVTGVDSTEKLDMLRALGADHVIDYTREDFTENGETYDVIFNVVVKSSYSRNVRSLNKGGRYLLTNPAGISQMLRAMWTSMTSNKKVITQFADEKVEDLVHLRELIEAGKLRSVIDRSYPLEQAAEAHRYVETDRKKGNVVLTMQGDIKS